MRRGSAALRCLAAVLAAAALARAAAAAPRGARGRPPPGSTLRAHARRPRRRRAPERGPGEPLRDRTDLGGGGATGRRRSRRFAQLTDTHVRDEESPARVPFLDRIGGRVLLDLPAAGGAEHARCSPPRSGRVNRARPARRARHRRHRRLRAAEDELDQALAVLDGGRVDPDTGAPRLRRRAGRRRTPTRSTTAPTSTRRATRACCADAAASVHARRACGPVVPGARQPRRARAGRGAAHARGSTRVATGDAHGRRARPRPRAAPRRRDGAAARRRGCSPSGVAGPRAAGARRPAPAVAAPAELLARLAGRRAAAARAAARARRSTTPPTSGRAVRVIVLDTVDRAGGSRGAAAARAARLAARGSSAAPAAAASSSSTHNPLDGTDGGAAALAALDADPRVVAVVVRQQAPQPDPPAPHGRRRLLARSRTSSLADFPQQARMFRLRARRRRLRAGDVDGRPGRRGRGRAGARARLPRRPGRAPAGLRRHARGPQRAAVRAGGG